MSNPVKSYFENTDNLLYSFLVSLPLFILYEFLIIISQPEGDAIVRISVDVWIKSLFTYLGVNAVSFSLLVVVIVGLFIIYRERDRLKTLKFSYFPILILESTIYAIVVAMISQSLVSLVLNLAASDPIETLTMMQKLALSLGAGLYEELFFRVILVTAFILVFTKILGKKWAGVTAAVVLSALLFSAVHYIGDMGDAFTMGSFLYRFLFGLILNGIYVWRGFGVAAWTHAIYDIMVITFLG
ncbi:MAG: CPBP family intramembrane metalloprotease [Balneola sp.]|jgi:membrane protease YdiL (CAAX protease family)|nr:CPBP family intramembrane metalloprotease [Balneola sp.]MBE77926.1 CPBP family intramembrane metalloprotease [Balneola sp.]|tara:strand:- start:829 stop:1554 length:726 start_codon:yes stop_codon:yes gene_type:complete